MLNNLHGFLGLPVLKSYYPVHWKMELCSMNSWDVKDPLNADVCHYSQQHSCLAACGTQKDQQAVATNNVAKKSVNLWKRTQNLKMPPLEQEKDWQKISASLCMFNNTFCDVSHRLGKRCREEFTSCNSRLDTEGLGPRDQKQRPPQDALDHRRDHRPLRHLMVTWHDHHCITEIWCVFASSSCYHYIQPLL